MPKNRKIHGSYTQRRIKALSERGKLMAAARWKIDRQRRAAEMPARILQLAEIEIQNFPRKQGDALGCLQWTDFGTGQVRRWVVEIGARRDQIVLRSPNGRRTRSHGWTWALSKLRACLCGSRVNFHQQSP